MRSANALALLTFFGIVHTHLLGMLSLPILRVVRVLALLRWLVLMAVLVLLLGLLVFCFAHGNSFHLVDPLQTKTFRLNFSVGEAILFFFAECVSDFLQALRRKGT